MKNLFPFLALGVAAIGISACAPERSVLNMPPGQYEKTTSSSNSNGTNVEQKKSASVGYDANGNKEAVVQSKTTIDPPGLFNKSTSTSTAVVR